MMFEVWNDCRSTSAYVDDAKAQRAVRRSASVDVKTDLLQERRHPAAASKFGWGSGLAINNRTEQKPTKEGARIPLQPINTRGVRTCRYTEKVKRSRYYSSNYSFPSEAHSARTTSR